MAAKANLGRWEAREVESVPIETPARGGADEPEPLAAPPDDGHRGDPPRPSPGPDGDRRFWHGVLVGLIPLVLLGLAWVGLRLAGGGEDDGADGDGTAIIAAVQDGAGQADQVDRADQVDTPTSLVVQTAPTTATTSPDPPTPSVLDVDPVSGEPMVATGMVTDGAVEVSGVLPDGLRAQWVGELADLATVLGYRLDDRTELAVGAAAGSTEATELLIRFPGAVVFRPESPGAFDGPAQPVFEAIAGVLNRGSADLRIVAYADPAAPQDALLALSRAEHVHEHLIALGVDPGRLTVEARSPEEAPIVAADGSPIDRRSDFEFRFRS